MGDTKGGSFDIPIEIALGMIREPSVSGKATSDVVTPWCNGLDITRRLRNVWIVDFGCEMNEPDASRFDAPIGFVRKHVLPIRQTNNREAYRKKWWIHVEPRPAMRAAYSGLSRFLATPNVTKHRLF